MTTTQDKQEVQRGTLHMMDDTGDTTITWNPTVPAEVAAARGAYNTLRDDKGYWAYIMEEGGARGEVIHEFDPAARAIVMAPQSVGG